MAISERALEIVHHIYLAYGTDSGILFGTPPHCRSAVEAVVQVTLDMVGAPEAPDTTEADSGKE